MGVIGSIITFLIIWWTVLFMVLPMRVKGVWEDDKDHVKGGERGAPIDPKLWFKAKRTTWISLILWFVAFVVVNAEILPFER
ncbi:MAG: DUF1467 family protein [Pseudomonadota bacterium]